MGQNSRRHHFVPQFYLKAWYEPCGDGFWLYFRDERGGIRLRRRSARAVGFAENLYSLQPDGLYLHQSRSDELEAKFFSRIDYAASLVHEKLLRVGVNSISAEERVVWALFVNSLLERSPRRIREIESKASDIPDVTIAELERRWANPVTWPSIKAALVGINKRVVLRNAVLSSLATFIADEKFINYVVAMTWLTVDLPAGPDHFLTGDTPVVVNGGGSNAPIYLLSIALSPRRLLVMYKDDGTVDRDFIGMVTMIHNIVITKQTEKYLVSSRELIDSHHIKYTRITAEMLGTKGG